MILFITKSLLIIDWFTFFQHSSLFNISLWELNKFLDFILYRQLLFIVILSLLCDSVSFVPYLFAVAAIFIFQLHFHYFVADFFFYIFFLCIFFIYFFYVFFYIFFFILFLYIFFIYLSYYIRFVFYYLCVCVWVLLFCDSSFCLKHIYIYTVYLWAFANITALISICVAMVFKQTN